MKYPTDCFFKPERRVRTNSFHCTKGGFPAYYGRMAASTRVGFQSAAYVVRSATYIFRARRAFTIGRTTLYGEFNISFIIIIAINVVPQARGNVVIFIFCFFIIINTIYTPTLSPRISRVIHE